MKIIRYLRPDGPYNAGETAGFPDTRADELIEAGIAEAYVPPVTEVEPPQGEAKVEPDMDTPTEAPPPETKVEPPPPVTKDEPPIKRRTGTPPTERR